MKSKKFMSLLAERVASDPKLAQKPKRLKKAFKQAVVSLKEGKLRNTLLEKFDDKFVELQNLLENSLKNARKVSRPTKAKISSKENGSDLRENATQNGQIEHWQLPYNLYSKKGRTICEDHLEHLDNAQKASIYQVYLRNALLFLDDQAVLEVAKKCQQYRNPSSKTWKSCMQILCSCVMGAATSQQIQKVMNIFQAEFATESETSFADSNTERLQNLRQAGHQFLCFFHMKYQSTDHEFPGSPSYVDLLASILATYIDICLSIKQSDVQDPAVTKTRICSFVLHMLGDHIHHSYDVLLQLDRLADNDQADLILPLASHVLEKQDSTECPKIYTKFALTSRMILKLFSEEDLGILKQKVTQVAAPSDYLAWIQDRNPTLLDNFPETKKFRKTKITRFIVNELDDDSAEAMLDLLTEEPASSATSESQTSKPNAPETQSSKMDDDMMFTIDKTPDIGIAPYLDDILKTSEIVGDEEGSDAEDIDLNDDLESEIEVEEIYVELTKVMDKDMPEYTIQNDKGNIIYESYVSRSNQTRKDTTAVNGQRKSVSECSENSSEDDLRILESPKGPNVSDTKFVSKQDAESRSESDFHQVMIKTLLKQHKSPQSDTNSVETGREGRRSLSPKKRSADLACQGYDNPSPSKPKGTTKSPLRQFIQTDSLKETCSPKNDKLKTLPSEGITKESSGSCTSGNETILLDEVISHTSNSDDSGSLQLLETDSNDERYKRLDPKDSDAVTFSNAQSCSELDLVMSDSDMDNVAGNKTSTRKSSSRLSRSSTKSPAISASPLVPDLYLDVSSEMLSEEAGPASQDCKKRRSASRSPAKTSRSPSNNGETTPKYTKNKHTDSDQTSATSTAEGSSTTEERPSSRTKRRKVDMKRNSPEAESSRFVSPRSSRSTRVKNFSSSDISELSEQSVTSCEGVPMNKQMRKILDEEGVRPRRRKTASAAEITSALKTLHEEDQRDPQESKSEESASTKTNASRRRSMPSSTRKSRQLAHAEESDQEADQEAAATFNSPKKARRQSEICLDIINRPLTRSRARTDSESSVTSAVEALPPTRVQVRRHRLGTGQSPSKRQPEDSSASDVPRPSNNRRKSMPVASMAKILQATVEPVSTPTKSPKAESRRYSLRTPTKKLLQDD